MKGLFYNFDRRIEKKRDAKMLALTPRLPLT
jgi:hypothetical protein